MEIPEGGFVTSKQVEWVNYGLLIQVHRKIQIKNREIIIEGRCVA